MHTLTIPTTHRGQNTTPTQWPIVDTVVHLVEQDIRGRVGEVAIEGVAMATTEKMVTVNTITTIVIAIGPGLIRDLDQGRVLDRGLVAEGLVLEVVVVPVVEAAHVVLVAELDHLDLDPDQNQPGREEPDRDQGLIAPDPSQGVLNLNQKNRCRCRNLPLNIWLPL